jgi:error-prone DNA polymerase
MPPPPSASAGPANGPFGSVDDLARRAGLSTAELRTLASAGALASLAGHRRQAWWAAAGSQAPPACSTTPRSRPAPPCPPRRNPEPRRRLRPPGFSLGRHPLVFLRAQLGAERFLSAADIATADDRKLARAAGIVTCRQRPGTARVRCSSPSKTKPAG